MSALHDDARRYLSTYLGGLDVSDLPSDIVEANVDQIFDGGWPAFKADFERFTSRYVKTTRPRSIYQQVQDLSTHVGNWHERTFRLKPHESWERIHISDDQAFAVVNTADVTETSRRTKVNRTGMKVMLWLPVGDGTWKRQEDLVMWFDGTSHDIHIWGAVNDLVRHASKMWQADMCFRPGTASSPMDGPIRKLEISHDEAFKNERFQSPVKHTTSTRTTNR